jgi:hypothetical protein
MHALSCSLTAKAFLKRRRRIHRVRSNQWAIDHPAPATNNARRRIIAVLAGSPPAGTARSQFPSPFGRHDATRAQSGGKSALRMRMGCVASCSAGRRRRRWSWGGSVTDAGLRNERCVCSARVRCRARPHGPIGPSVDRLFGAPGQGRSPARRPGLGLARLISHRPSWGRVGTGGWVGAGGPDGVRGGAPSSLSSRTWGGRATTCRAAGGVPSGIAPRRVRCSAPFARGSEARALRSPAPAGHLRPPSSAGMVRSRGSCITSIGGI